MEVKQWVVSVFDDDYTVDADEVLESPSGRLRLLRAGVVIANFPCQAVAVMSSEQLKTPGTSTP